MVTPRHEARLQAVLAEVRRAAPARIADLGCGAGELALRLAALPGVRRVIGVDTDRAALGRAAARLAARAPGGAPVDLVAGAIADGGPYLRGIDCAVMVEVLEHMPPDRLTPVERAVFARMRPRTVILTTPDAGMNAALGVPPHRFRHPDHRFEWDAPRFARWARGVAARHGYTLRTGPAERPGGPATGSQMAVFARADGG